MRHLFPLLVGTLFASSPARAVETKTWTQSEAAEFEKGTAKGLSISSTGRITLAPRFKEVYDPSLAYVWALATDSKGNLYAGGAGGKLLRVDGKGKGQTAAELPGGDIYALAVNRRDEVFAAVSPEAKVYKLVAGGKAEVFYDSKEKYIWAMAFNAQGDLLLATGDQGRIHRVPPNGNGSVFAETGETHARSVVVDGTGNLIAGTEPSGLVIRISPKAESFVLYQTARREVTSIAVSREGVIYAAAVGSKQPAPATPAPSSTSSSSTPTPPASSLSTQQGTQSRTTTTAPPSLSTSGPVIRGGSEIYRIEPDGAPRRVWSSSEQVAYALAFDAQGRLVAATGNQGVLYRIDSDRSSTRLIDAAVTQFTTLAQGTAGQLFGATANAGKIYQVGPEFETEGTLESEVFDATMFTYWGRLRYENENHGGSVKLETRSGNLERQYNHWSPWVAVADRIQSPPARFLAWRATLKASPEGHSPELTLVEAAYVAKNVAPVIERVEITPANYKFASSSLTLTPSASLSLPAIGQPRRSSPAVTPTETSGPASMTYDKGSLGARWRATDLNGDTLSFRLEVRGVQEKEWKRLKDELREARYSWDSTGFADGKYLLRVIASDAIDNYPGQDLKAEMLSEPFVIDNTPPQISGLQARLDGEHIRLTFKSTDGQTPLALAEYSVNGGEWIAAEPTTRITDSLAHEYDVIVTKVQGGEFTIAVKVTDENDNVAVQKVVVAKP